MAALRIRSRKRRTAEMTLGAGASEGLLPLSQRDWGLRLQRARRPDGHRFRLAGLAAV